MKVDPRGAIVLLLFLTFAFTGCATIFSGTSDSITFESNPSGAMVRIDGIDQGRTPLTTSVKRSLGGADVMYELEGYETRSFELGQEFNMTALANLLCFAGFWICGGIDLLTGAALKYDPKTYSVDLRERRDLEEALEVEEVVFEYELERDTLGYAVTDQLRPNVALVNSVTKQIVIIR